MNEGSTTATDVKQAARDLQAEGSRVAQDVAEEVKTAGRDVADAARSKAESMAEQGKEAGAQQGEGLAQAARRIADDLQERSPEIAQHVRSAADSIESMAQSLRQRSVGDLIQEMNGFAQRQPAAFFGVAMLAGFAAVRFAKSSSSMSGYSGMSHGATARTAPERAPGWTGQPTQGEFKPATLPAATLGGAAAHRPGTAMPGSMPGPDTGRV
ncbi:hypothetical protein [Teichococcus oryzae]|uniref:hypothetical protein n=1 Tax=Teichococcus oryzae TaxID=1608942 RepID=UPI0013762C5C|nr:hypothetical protein [Pseudoroseomonas oryzae]